jgi:hypothetical protein
VCAESGSHRAVGGLLVAHDQRRVDRESAGQDLVLAELVYQVAAHLLDEVGGGAAVLVDPSRAQHGRLRQRQLVLLRRDVPLFLHAAQHEQLARPGELRVVERRVAGRGGHDARDQGGLGQRELLDRLSEVDLGGGLDAVRPGAQVDLVQVEVQDLVLVEVLLDPHGEHHVLDLADVGPVRRQEERLGDLLGDGAPALLDAAGAQVGPGGAGDSREVEPGVRVERVVLRRDEGLDQELRDHLDGHDLGRSPRRRPSRCA